MYKSILQGLTEALLMSGSYRVRKLKVYVVLEHNKGKRDCRIHGVYGIKQAAVRRVEKVKTKKSGYISILELPVRDSNMLSVCLIESASGQPVRWGFQNG